MTLRPPRRRSSRVLFSLGLASLVALTLPETVASAPGQVSRVGTGRGVAQLEAKQQRREGNVFYADGDVDIRYENVRLQADHVEYNADTGEAVARGSVRLDIEQQHVEAEEARYNLRTGQGRFRRVRGRIQVQRRPNPNLLVSPNPISFEAREVERLDASTYRVHGAWVTVCEPDKPIWKFYAPQATIKLERSVRLVHANFRLLRVPVIYLPYATAPIGRKVRQSGFLVPHFANTSRKGFVVGDAFYWAPAAWLDLTVGAEYLSRRGWSQQAELRARPWENARLEVNYYGVVDRGLPDPNGVRVPQGGHKTHIELDSRLPGGWRAVADLNQLTSLRFRLVFAETFAEAVNSEVRSAAFASNRFRGFNLSFSAVNYKNFLSALPETAVVLRQAPGVRFSSVEQAPWKRVPIYFGFQASAEATHRSEPGFETAAAVQRTELAPRVTVPLRWGPWLGLTPTFVARTTRYGSSRPGGPRSNALGPSARRTTGEVTVDIRPPTLARTWEEPQAGGAWKHAIEPRLVYRYVNGVDRFERFIRFDENDTLTDTNELEYSITQRLYRRSGSGHAEELVSWRVAQKYSFDPTFGGALVAGQRNVFQALNSLTGFAFADGPRRFSPLVSDLRIAPGGRYDAQFRVDIDPVRAKMTALGTLVNLRPCRSETEGCRPWFLTLAHFATQANATLQPLSNQIRALVGYGEINRRGLNGSFGFSYDVRQRFLQNQVVQVSYNGACCGISFEFRRLALGPVRSENQFRVALLVANIGTFGNLRRQEKIF